MRVLAIAAVLSVATPAGAECSLDHRIFPLLVWSTSPNSGNTWGLMPVVMTVCPDDHYTHWILAPSITWNSIIHYTGTGRWFLYPDKDTTITAIASVSTRYNYRASLVWDHLPVERWAISYEALGRLERSVFDRFYGIGPDTDASAESSYTGWALIASGRVGLNLGDDVNLGVTLEGGRNRVENLGVKGLPLAPEAFPSAPGMTTPATFLSQGLDLRYDDRDGGDFAERGTRVELWGAYVEGIRGSRSYARGGAQASTIVPELEWLTGAARIYWNAVSSSKIPFYVQSTLGGASLLRGFNDGRFYDRMAWTAEVEQRLRLVQTHFFGVVTDWRIDPFIAVGQVYGSWNAIVSHPRIAGGLGLRLFVHPRVLGRIDIAYGGEGVKTYVEIGYPY